MLKKTSDLSKIEKGHPFVWGEIRKIHKIGEYSIVEYLSKDDENVSVLFHPYYEDRSDNVSYHALDDAIAGIIAFKYEGFMHRADHYFLNAIRWS